MNARNVKAVLASVFVRFALLLGLAATMTAPLASAQETTEAAPSVQVDIQSATAAEFEQLPGIGPSKAAAIVAYREQHPFRRIEDIMRVRGIGRATFRRLRSMLTISGSTRRARASD